MANLNKMTVVDRVRLARTSGLPIKIQADLARDSSAFVRIAIGDNPDASTLIRNLARGFNADSVSLKSFP